MVRSCISLRLIKSNVSARETSVGADASTSALAGTLLSCATETLEIKSMNRTAFISTAMNPLSEDIGLGLGAGENNRVDERLGNACSGLLIFECEVECVICREAVLVTVRCLSVSCLLRNNLFDF